MRLPELARRTRDVAVAFGRIKLRIHYFGNSKHGDGSCKLVVGGDSWRGS